MGPVHDLCVSFAEDFDKKVIQRLKSWAGLFRSSDSGTLFRRRASRATADEPDCVLQKVATCEVLFLKYSKDPVIKEIYEIRKIAYSRFPDVGRARKLWKR